ncbi:MAG: diaminopimelate decarboxylase [Candidatus Hydrogenedentota bacterium]
MELLQFLTNDQVRILQQDFGTPVFVYDEATIEGQAREVLNFPYPYGLTARFAMKALPTGAILKLLHELGLHIDASSGFEVERAMKTGIPPEHIQLTAQELPQNLVELITAGIQFNACSLKQLAVFGEHFAGSSLGVRMNPGLGSGHNNRTNVGGPSSSFGIWREYVPEVLDICRQYDLHVTRVHTHIGSGGEPDVWMRCARLSLEMAAQFSEVSTLNLGGGFKVGRMPGEVSADLREIGARVSDILTEYADTHGKELKLEIEPGTFIVANAGVLVAGVSDVVGTGKDGYKFVKIDAGMTDILRPAIYGAQHPITLVPAIEEEREPEDYLVVGHCCESGDVLTPETGNPEGLHPRTLVETRIGDALVIGGAGAYCSAMCCKNYNSFPESPEVLLKKNGEMQLIRERQTLDHMLANERLS